MTQETEYRCLICKDEGTVDIHDPREGAEVERALCPNPTCLARLMESRKREKSK